VQPAPWGIFPVLVLAPCLLVMILLGIMGFELAQTQQGYKQGFMTGSWVGLLVRSIVSLTSPKRQRGRLTSALADASGWYCKWPSIPDCIRRHSCQ